MKIRYLYLLTIIFFIFIPESLYAVVPECDAAELGMDNNITRPLVTCVTVALRVATVDLLATTSTIAAGFIPAIIALSVAIFGYKLVMGENEITKKAFSWLFKIALVVAFSDNLAGFAEPILDAMEGLLTLVTDNMPLGSSSCSVERGASAVADIWSYLDCLLWRVFGLENEVTNAHIFGSAIFAIAVFALGSGTIGIFIFFLGITSLITLLSLVYRSVMTYLLSYATVCLMIVFSPLAIPTSLFAQSNTVFRQWYKTLLGTIFLQVVVIAGMIIMVPLIDYAIYDAPYSIDKELSRLQIYEAIREESAAATSAAVPPEAGAGSLTNRTPGENNAALDLVADFDSLKAGATSVAAALNLPNFDFGANHDLTMVGLARSLIILWVICWLVRSMMTIILNMATHMLGSGYAINQALEGGGTLGKRTGRMVPVGGGL